MAKQSKASKPSWPRGIGRSGSFVVSALDDDDDDKQTQTQTQTQKPAKRAPAPSEPGSTVQPSKRAKRAKPSSAVQAQQERQDEPAGADQETLTLEVSAGADDIEEVEHLFQRALADLDAGQDDSARLLLRGCVHECDKMVRIRTGHVPNATDEERDFLEASAKTLPPLTPSFYWVYGFSLLHLGISESALRNKPKFSSEADHAQEADDQDVQDAESNENGGGQGLLEYLEATLDPIESGLALAAAENNTAITGKLHALLAAVKLRKSGLVHHASPKMAKALVAETKNHMKLAETAAYPTSSDHASVLAEMARECKRYADHDATSPKQEQEWLSAASRLWELALKDEPNNIKALVGLGSIALSAGCKLSESDDEDAEDASDPEAAIKLLKTAANYFRKVLDLTQKDGKASVSSVPVLCLLGEACVELGNLHEDDDDEGEDSEEAIAFYREAVDAFKQVLSVDAKLLPSMFEEFLQDWEKDMV
ncbi:hypothetical protein BC831DRAFT_453623 [Entophlyctis helioformis]|nr:hypothetical protein BC831DRAFT_453623 [Entophlyctis helioformis]